MRFRAEENAYEIREARDIPKQETVPADAHLRVIGSK